MSLSTRVRKVFGWLFKAIRMVWTISIVCGLTAAGAWHGWTTGGVAGAIALGFCGYVAGAICAIEPLVFFELIS